MVPDRSSEVDGAQALWGKERLQMHTLLSYIFKKEKKKKKEIMPFAVAWMQLEILILNDVSQKERDKLTEHSKNQV